jgi:hypothetical protein
MQDDLLTALSPRPPGTNAVPGTRDSPLKKKFADFAQSNLKTDAGAASRLI